MEDVYCFGGNPLDRASERRDERDWITRLGDPQTRLLPLRESVRSFAETRWAGPTPLGLTIPPSLLARPDHVID